MDIRVIFFQISATKWNKWNEEDKKTNILSGTNSFCEEIRSKHQTFSFRRSKLINSQHELFAWTISNADYQ